jgi:hypothetical protein
MTVEMTITSEHITIRREPRESVEACLQRALGLYQPPKPNLTAQHAKLRDRALGELTARGPVRPDRLAAMIGCTKPTLRLILGVDFSEGRVLSVGRGKACKYVFVATRG